MDTLLPAGVRIALCLGLAFLCHILFYQIALTELSVNLTPEIKKTVPVVNLLSTPNAIAQVAATSTSTQTQSEQKKVLSTQGEALQNTALVATNKHFKIATQTTIYNKQPRHLDQQAPSSRQTQTLASSFTANTELSNDNIATHKQKSTRKAPKLSPYQLKLVQHLLKAELYDTFHSYMRAEKKTRIDYQLRITLDENGILKKGTIKKSTGILKLDQQALSAAYSASPYPQPPEADWQHNFSYDIPISYQNLKNLH